jgi:hypothetical protein
MDTEVRHCIDITGKQSVNPTRKRADLRLPRTPTFYPTLPALMECHRTAVWYACINYRSEAAM